MEESHENLFYIYLLIARVGRTHVSQSMCGGEKTAKGSLFAPPTVWMLSLDLRLSGVVVASLPLSHLVDPHLFNFS